MAFAIKHPDRTSALVLRGIFMVRRQETPLFYQQGCSEIYPTRGRNIWCRSPRPNAGDLISAYHKRLTSPDPQIRAVAARAWSVWEAATLEAPPRRQASSSSRRHPLRRGLRRHRVSLLRQPRLLRARDLLLRQHRHAAKEFRARSFTAATTSSAPSRRRGSSIARGRRRTSGSFPTPGTLHSSPRSRASSSRRPTASAALPR